MTITDANNAAAIRTAAIERMHSRETPASATDAEVIEMMAQDKADMGDAISAAEREIRILRRILRENGLAFR